MLKAIAAFILSHSGLPWALGENFFAGYMPVKNTLDAPVPERVMVLLERVPAAVDGYLPDYAAKAVQIWNRAREYFAARDDAQQVYELLHGASGWDLPEIDSGEAFYAMTIDAIGTPAPIANPNENGLFEFSTNYIFRIERDPTIP